MAVLPMSRFILLVLMVVCGLVGTRPTSAQRAESPVFVLLGCDVVGGGEPQVEFAQIPDRVIGIGFIGRGDFVGEKCADVLSVLLGSGFSILTSRPVQQSAGREIIVYDLIAK